MSRFKDSLEKLLEQEAFQQIRAKWEEIDPEVRTYISLGAGALVALIISWNALSSLWGSYQIKNQLDEKIAMMDKIHSIKGEIQKLDGPTSARGGDTKNQNWSGTVQSIANKIGVEATQLKVGEQKPGSTAGSIIENLFDLEVSRINLRQLVTLAYQLEQGGHPIKIRNLEVMTLSEGEKGNEGWLNAKFSLSGFSVK